MATAAATVSASVKTAMVAEEDRITVSHQFRRECQRNLASQGTGKVGVISEQRVVERRRTVEKVSDRQRDGFVSPVQCREIETNVSIERGVGLHSIAPTHRIASSIAYERAHRITRPVPIRARVVEEHVGRYRAPTPVYVEPRLRRHG